MLALSVRQPYADQIMRGTKRIEYRSRPTKVRGRVYIYASLKPASSRGEDLPRGVIVGAVEIHNCTGSPGKYHWHLRNPKRLSRPRKPVGKPQPVWFNPFPK
jgi:predicted transcriptional regulator